MKYGQKNVFAPKSLLDLGRCKKDWHKTIMELQLKMMILQGVFTN